MSDKRKVLVISSAPPRKPTDTPGEAWLDLCQYTWATQQKYCDLHGYTFKTDISDLRERVRPTKRGEPIGPEVPIRYKIKFLLFQHYLNPDSCGENWDWVVWMDSDLLITNYDIPLEKFFNAERGTDIPEQTCLGDIILTRDVNGLHATVIMIRRTPESLGYVYFNGEAGMRYYMEDDWSDQLTQRMALQTSPYREMAWFHSVKSLCAMVPGRYTHIPERARKQYEWEPGDFALHLSALSIKERIKLSKKWIEEYKLL